MKKGLLSLLVAAIALSGVTTAFAHAPVIKTLPDVTIGDAEDNIGTDNNLFVFTNAFKFDDYVSDQDTTPVSSLLWTFDEGDPATPSSGWYTINGKSPVHVGTAAQAGDANTATPAGHTTGVSPTNELRSADAFATFRDVVFSPTSGSAPYPDPSEDHSAGKVITFYVSDGTQAASKDIIVNTVDNGFDSVTVPPGFNSYSDDTFDSNNPTFWQTTGATLGDTSLNTPSHDGSVGAYRVQVNSVASRYKFLQWYNQRLDWMPYSQVGTEKYVRAKYYMYNTGTNGNTASYSNCPSFNMKLASRFAVTTELFVQTHDNSQPANNPMYAHLAPSTNPATPSVYRVDYDPIDVPFLSTQTPEEGIQSAFEAFVIHPEDNGIIGMTEEVLGTYPASSLTGTPLAEQDYDGTLLTSANSLDTNESIDSGVPAGTFPPTTANAGGSITNSGSGASATVTFNTSTVASNKIGHLERLFYAGADGSQRIRVAENEQYKIRWHITSTRPTSTQGWMWLNNRTANFGYTQYLQIAGGQTSGGTNQSIARQALPGVGSLNPDKDGSENGGWYTVLMYTPLNGDIRSETAASVATELPELSAAPDRGSSTSPSAKDIRVTFVVYDTLSSNGGTEAAEAAIFTVDRIEITAWPAVQD
jgi:hypothetical protein